MEVGLLGRRAEALKIGFNKNWTGRLVQVVGGISSLYVS